MATTLLSIPVDSLDVIIQYVIHTSSFRVRDHVRITSILETCSYLRNIMSSDDCAYVYISSIPRVYFDISLKHTRDMVNNVHEPLKDKSYVKYTARNAMNLYDNPQPRVVYVVNNKAFTSNPKLCMGLLSFANTTAEESCVCVHHVYSQDGRPGEARKIALEQHDSSSSGHDRCPNHCIHKAKWFVNQERKRKRQMEREEAKKRREFFTSGWFARFAPDEVHTKLQTRTLIPA